MLEFKPKLSEFLRKICNPLVISYKSYKICLLPLDIGILPNLCRLSKNHWRQVVKCRVHTSDARLIKTIDAVPRRKARYPRLSITAKSRRGAQSPRPAELDARVPITQQWQNAGLEAMSNIISMAKCRAQGHVSTVNEPCVSVITTLITGSITDHVMRGVTSIMEDF